MGVDFDVDFDDNDGDNEAVASPSNQTEIKNIQPMVLYGDIKLDYVGVQTPWKVWSQNTCRIYKK